MVKTALHNSRVIKIVSATEVQAITEKWMCWNFCTVLAESKYLFQSSWGMSLVSTADLTFIIIMYILIMKEQMQKLEANTDSGEKHLLF